MTERDQPIPQDHDENPESSTGQANDESPTGRGDDDRRGEVRPNDRPVPRSPDPEEDVVRKGQETLERVKPY